VKRLFTHLEKLTTAIYMAFGEAIGNNPSSIISLEISARSLSRDQFWETSSVKSDI
jgi:hypothetical protein